MSTEHDEYDEYQARVREWYPDHADTHAWLRQHPDLELEEALVVCEDVGVLLRLWSVSDLPLRLLYQGLRQFSHELLEGVPAAHRDEALKALDSLGSTLPVIPKWALRRRLRRMSKVDNEALGRVVRLVEAMAPYAMWGDALRGPQLMDATRELHIQTLEQLVDAIASASVEAQGGPAQGHAAFRAAGVVERERGTRGRIVSAIHQRAADAIAAYRQAEAERAKRAATPRPQPAPEPPPSVARVLGTTTLYALVYPLGVALVSAALGTMWGFIVGTVVGIASFLVFIVRVGEAAAAIAAAVGIFGMVAATMGGPSALRLAFQSGREGVSIQALTQDPEAAWYTFTDARVRGDLQYTRTLTGHDSKSHQSYTYQHAIAPLVAEDWQPGQPISAWAYCTSRGTGSRYRRCLQAWSTPNLGVVRATPMSLSEMEETRRLASVGGPRAEGAGAPIFEWLEDPLKKLRRDTQVACWLLGLTYLISVLTYLIRRRRSLIAR